MPNPYSLDLRWRIVWIYLVQRCPPGQIASPLNVSERTVMRYIALFHRTGDVQVKPRTNGPKRLLGDFEQLKLLRLIQENPGIYLYELQKELTKSGIRVSNATICRTLKYMGCTRQAMHHVALQRSEISRARFMADISMYDPLMLVWLDESGCDRRNTIIFQKARSPYQRCMASFLTQTAKISSNYVMIIVTSGVWFHYVSV